MYVPWVLPEPSTAVLCCQSALPLSFGPPNHLLDHIYTPEQKKKNNTQHTWMRKERGKNDSTHFHWSMTSLRLSPAKLSPGIPPSHLPFHLSSLRVSACGAHRGGRGTAEGGRGARGRGRGVTRETSGAAAAATATWRDKRRVPSHAVSGSQLRCFAWSAKHRW